MEKGLTYLLLLIVFLAPSYVILMMTQEAYFGTVSHPFSILLVLLIALLLVGTGRLKAETQNAIARTLFRRRYDMSETLSKFSKAMVTILDLKMLTEEIVRTLVTGMNIKSVTLYLVDKEKAAYVPASSHGAGSGEKIYSRLNATDGLVDFLAKCQAPIVVEELKHLAKNDAIRPVLDRLQSMGAEVCIPFINKNYLVGFCNLGARRTRQMYSDQDLNLLTMLAQAAAIALDNAALYEELKRSRSLVQRTDRLRSLETIAGGFAHEVRNPLTSIKTFIQLTPERKDDPEFIGHFSTVVAEDVARIERLIQEILDYARYMQPKFQEEDMNVIVESCLYFIRIKADSKMVWLKKDLASHLPPVLLDRQQIKQVLLNLFINAIEAMNDHGGQLIVRTHRLSKAPGDTWVQMEVTDTGCGIAPADLEHIFDPFYTTKHESEEHEGTGLGLTIVHQIVQEHGGHIEVKSEIGRGTTFLVNLPAVPVRVLEAPMETRSV
jgi:two-component system, NtrC family, sensor kinase